MKYSIPAILAASVAFASVPVFASHAEGTDLEGSAHLTMKECMKLQAAKKDGASRADMKKACKWTSEATSSTNSLSSSEKPRAVDSTPYGTLPSVPTPPQQ